MQKAINETQKVFNNPFFILNLNFIKKYERINVYQKPLLKIKKGLLNKHIFNVKIKIKFLLK